MHCTRNFAALSRGGSFPTYVISGDKCRENAHHKCYEYWSRYRCAIYRGEGRVGGEEREREWKERGLDEEKTRREKKCRDLFLVSQEDTYL